MNKDQLNDYKKYLDKGTMVYFVASNAFEFATSIKARVKAHLAYNIAINSKDYIYPDVMAWLLSQVPPQNQKSLYLESIHTEDTYDDNDVYMSGKKPTRNGYSIRTRVDDNRQAPIFIEGHKVYFTFQKDAVDPNNMYVIKPDVIKFTTYSKDGQAAVQRKINDILAKKKTASNGINLYTVTGGGYWNSYNITKRHMSSVILKDGQAERVTNDLQNFLDSEREYVRRGIPWHRGYLFYGPPGTGKTSFARALASEFGLNLYYVSLGDIGKDVKLVSMLRDIGPQSILLLEDIDIFHAAKERDSDGEELSLSGLLNALDGVVTPHGLITIMTTNNKDALDEAVIRSGRVDLAEEIGLADYKQIRDTFQYFYSQPLTSEIYIDNVAISDVVELFKRNMDDPIAAEKELINWSS